MTARGSAILGDANPSSQASRIRTRQTFSKRTERARGRTEAKYRRNATDGYAPGTPACDGPGPFYTIGQGFVRCPNGSIAEHEDVGQSGGVFAMGIAPYNDGRRGHGRPKLSTVSSTVF